MRAFKVSKAFCAPTSIIEDKVNLAAGVKVWNFSHIRSGVQIGSNTIIGDYVYIGPDVEVGGNCKIQNSAQIYESAKIEDGVFVGPGVILTNDKNPRAIKSDKSQKSKSDWKPVSVEIKQGASIGAGAICIGPVQIGQWAMIGAGSVVVDDVLNHALVAGVPAKQIGWVGKDGVKLVEQTSTTFKCPISEKIYNLEGTNLVELIS
jgi:UDP-2-acetamido-3-amino-2,3-dideoxy-glucuronate N-acetyltransferase